MSGAHLSWSVPGHVLSKEQSKEGSDRVSDDGRLTIVQCHHYHRPPSLDLHRSSVGILEVMSLGHHKDLRGFMSASFGTIWNTSLLVICSFHYHMLFMITLYMFMFRFSINTPVCCMYFASSNINLATYFSLTRSRLP